jgi:hypothetical protein
VEASRKHGSFDTRWPGLHERGSGAKPAASPLPADETAEGLDWNGFTHRYFPERRRHDSEVRAAYIAYTQGREWRTTPARLSVVPGDPASVPGEGEPHEAATRRLMAAMAENHAEDPRVTTGPRV